jgi:TonB family protein
VAPPEPKAKPKPAVRTEVFARNETVTAKPAVAPRDVQTGGFGDPQGVASKEETRAPGARERLGSFDLPVGPGQGNGTGGAKGAARTVASTGFGDGATRAEPGTGAARESVRAGGFAEASAPPPAARPKPRTEAVLSHPVEIVNKPKPQYTDEARRRRIEGEVVLEVLFSAAGRPQVLRVVSGLGAGLDESAMRAAEQISFKPLPAHLTRAWRHSCDRSGCSLRTSCSFCLSPEWPARRIRHRRHSTRCSTPSCCASTS